MSFLFKDVLKTYCENEGDEEVVKMYEMVVLLREATLGALPDPVS